MARKEVLVAGGAGYVGSHTVVELYNAGYLPVVIDNFANASKGAGSEKPESLLRVEKLTQSEIPFYCVDLRRKAEIDAVFAKHQIEFVLHFAGLKAVGESCDIPLEYYQVNVSGTINLLQVMDARGVRKLAFSSSATVYGQPDYLPIDEKHAAGKCTNPYGKTKFFIEQILEDLVASKKGADARWAVVILRYFNPVGAHSSGLIGEDPRGPPNNLMPFVAQVAVGRQKKLRIFGNDYDTPDGTGVRDYIHVVDLARGHVSALAKLTSAATSGGGAFVYNLGTGKGFSVMEMVSAFEKASGKEVPYEICCRRPGDVASVYGDVSLACTELSWSATRGLSDMCEDLWRFQSKNPDGYGPAPATTNHQ